MDMVLIMQRLSTYTEDAKARYREKMEVIGGNDPFFYLDG